MRQVLHSCFGAIAPLATGFVFVFAFMAAALADASSTNQSLADNHGALSARVERFKETARVHRRHVRRIMQRRGVVASGTGLDADGEPIVRVFLADRDVRGVPTSLDGVRVRTTVSGRIYALRQPTCDISGDMVCASTEAWPLPVPIGVSAGHPAVTAGTIGARVTDGVNVFLLSNNHVLADANAAEIGNPSIQPGSFDGGSPDDSIGTLSDFEPLQFCECTLFFFGICWRQTCPVNTMDAAIALSSPGELGMSTSTGEYGSLDGYGTPNSSLHTAYGAPAVVGDEDLFSLLNTSVQKVGRTTGLTTGTVDTVNATVSVCYDQTCTLRASFDEQIIIVPGNFSDGGDSGSLIVTNDATRQAVGLLFAGSATHTIANRADLVLNRFGVTIDDGGGVVDVTDAGILSVAAPPTQVRGEPATVSVSVTNFGNQPIPAGAIAVSLTDTEPDTVSGSPQSVHQPLDPGADIRVDFDWQPMVAGQHTLEASLTLTGDMNADNNAGTATSSVVEAGASGPLLQLRNVTARTDTWTPVALDYDYGDEMVVACSPNYDLSTTGPAMVRVRNASGSSFEVGVARPWFGALEFEQFAIDVHCMVVRAGVYSSSEHGVTMEAVRLAGFSSTDNAVSWGGESQSYLNPAGYTAPVIVGQVISDDNGLPPSHCPDASGNICDRDWSVFWSRGSSQSNPPSPSTLYVGRHSGEDTALRPSETLTYIVIESGNGAIEGWPYAAALGSDTIRGMQNNPPFTYPLAGLVSASTAIVSQSAMDGANGGWAVLYGSGLTASQLPLAIDEDWFQDSERSHTTEQVYYIVFE